MGATGTPCGEERTSSLGLSFCPQGTPENPGINQRALQLLFSEVQEKASDWEYTITVSVAEIYNEVLRWAARRGAALRLEAVGWAARRWAAFRLEAAGWAAQALGVGTGLPGSFVALRTMWGRVGWEVGSP